MIIKVPKTKSKQEKGNNTVRIVPEQIKKDKNMIHKSPLSMIYYFYAIVLLFLTACNSNGASTSNTKESKKELDKYEKLAKEKTTKLKHALLK